MYIYTENNLIKVAALKIIFWTNQFQTISFSSTSFKIFGYYMIIILNIIKQIFRKQNCILPVNKFSSPKFQKIFSVNESTKLIFVIYQSGVREDLIRALRIHFWVKCPLVFQDMLSKTQNI